jgi:hypothetical protein
MTAVWRPDRSLPLPGHVRDLSLVFVPGLVSHLELQRQQLSYRRFVTALEQACRVIRFDNHGGRGAIAFAAAYPGRVLGLILYGTSPAPQAARPPGISSGLPRARGWRRR